MADLVWTFHHPLMTSEMLGYIPDFLSAHNPKPAVQQLHEAYRHGGGWHKFEGFKMLPNKDLSYPDDPPVRLLASCTLRDEEIRFYQHSWVAVVQKDGSFEVARMD